MVLTGKVALVTGAGRGIGKATALALATAGADLVLVNRNQNTAEEVQQQVEKLGQKALVVPTDISDPEAVKALAETALKEMGKVDILVNNAGMTQDALFMRMKEEQWEDVLNVNLNGTFRVTKVLIKSMVKQRYGRVINISSVVGYTGNPGQVNYSTTKAGLIGFTKSLAKEVGARNITVNAIAPGFIETDMTGVLGEEQQQRILAQIALGKMGKPEDIANTVVFLASEQASYITGTTIHVNGGMF